MQYLSWFIPAFLSLLALESASAGATRPVEEDAGSPTDDVVDVLIVGAGWVGMSAAHHLVKHGIDNVLVLESANYTGGRTHAIEFGLNKTIVETGSTWVCGGPACEECPPSIRVNKVWELAQAAGFDTPTSRIDQFVCFD